MTQAEQPAPERQAEAVAALAEAIRAAGASSGPGPEPAAAPGPRTDEQHRAALAAAAEVLADGGAPTGLAGPAVAALGESAGAVLREDPWAVLGLPGVRPDQADGFARGLLGATADPSDPRRAGALVPWLLEQAVLRGHSAQEIGEVAAGLEAHRVPDAATALQEAVVDGRVMAFQEELPGHRPTDEDEEPPTRTLLALERLALAEESLGEGLVRLRSTLVPGTDAPADAPADAETGQDGDADSGTDTEDADTEDAEPGADAQDGAEHVPVRPGPAAWEAAAAAAPSSSAAALIRAVADDALVVHTGGEASRAELAALLAAADGLGLQAWAATWTDHGSAALGALLDGSPAAARVTTLAGLLGGAADGPARAVDGTLGLDLLVVPDAQLLDVELAATLLEALADGTRLVLSGDPAQLWSAGPGRFLADLAAARFCPVVASRTPDTGPVGELVSGISIGELQPVEAPEKEVVVLAVQDAGEAVHRAVQLIADSIPRALGIPAEQVVLLTAGHAGSAGTRALNAAAKARLNPGPGTFGGFDPGDRVAWSPAPGTTLPGRVLDGDAAGLHLELADGTRLTLSPAQVDRLRHGWALTAHQAVGRRWPGVVAVVPGDAGALLTRQWAYTAFGRAERHLSVVHPAGPLLAQAVAERPGAPRTTRLRAILAEHTGGE
ncbi:helix-hairpin-helix domain-containing protein [Kitasatospora sp. NBC_01539]|uniref:helix-hairpin-helix domain-containing protein n=1 Tax=Kitasatospora sp. NBC_01539 TaxID=2903577 RepID=UPI00386029F3